MRTRRMLYGAALAAIVVVAYVLLGSGAAGRPHAALAGPGSLPPLIGCPNVDGSDNNLVSITDVSKVISAYRHDYPDPGYSYLYDFNLPYNYQSPVGTGQIRITDISYVIARYRNVCPVLDTQIAKATRAIGDPTFSDKLCDGTAYATAVNCGGDAQFLTENVSFLASRGYLRGSSDVPGQGVHYVNYSYWNGIFNPVRPPGLVYKNGRLAAQLYYAAGDPGASMGGDAGVGWAPSPTSNVRAVNIDAVCTPEAGEPASVGGCSWAGSFDGFHWHANLCTYGIGTTGAWAVPSPSFTNQTACGAFAANHVPMLGPNVTCTFPPTPNFNCAWGAAVGWMGHLWNWLPNANFTNSSSPSPNAAGLCQLALCATLESNGRFADCNPDGGWNAYNCPQ